MLLNNYLELSYMIEHVRDEVVNRIDLNLCAHGSTRWIWEIPRRDGMIYLALGVREALSEGERC